MSMTQFLYPIKTTNLQHIIGRPLEDISNMSSNSGVDDSDRRQFGSGSREISMSRKVCTSYEQNIKEAICANCGKGEEGGINLKSCTACKMVSFHV